LVSSVRGDPRDFSQVVFFLQHQGWYVDPPTIHLHVVSKVANPNTSKALYLHAWVTCWNNHHIVWWISCLMLQHVIGKAARKYVASHWIPPTFPFKIYNFIDFTG
jgi:hypothetical protein